MAYNFGCVLLGCMHLLLLWNFSAVRGQDFYNYTYPGTFRSSPSDLYALKQLWNAWNSTPDVSNNLAGWNALVNDTIMTPCVPESPWRGVYCNAVRNAAQSTVNNTVWDLDIVSLVLDNVSLKGTIPAGIANLSNLVTVSVTRNPELTGPLPVEAENLYSLFQLDLHGNSITGELPQWNQDAFPFLQTINVAENKMTGEMLTNLTNSFRAVQTLNLSYNSFHGEIVDVFFYLHKAVSMDLSHNNFSGSMPNLTSVTVEGTNLQSWGPLSYLDLSSNKFTGSLPNMNGHHTLQFFNVSQNQFSGELNPEMLSNVSTLDTMDLSHNRFTGSISNLANLISLRHLDLSYNNFSPGSFPTWTVDLIHLQILSLRGLSLSGSVPFSVIAAFQSLQTLELDDNNLRGTLDLNHMPTKSSSLQLVSLTNNKIEHVAYLGRVANIIVKFNLLGNPYCDNSASETSDLKRCMCQQICLDTRGQSNKKVIIIASVGGSMLAAVIIVYSLIFWRSKKEGYKLLLGAEQKFAEYEVKPTIYTYSELQAITKSFSTKLGRGAFGVVYKGTLSNGVEVAVKQLYTKSQQSLDDFLNEIVLVTAVKHRNLVKLKGCCIRKDQRLLVYEYVENGDLDQFLFGNEDDKRKDWTIRRNICYEVAEGIQYLHFANQPKIIHRDIKACNILLDKNLEPKIADFGLALLYPNEESRIMTIHVAGTRGYLAPEYAHLGLLSEKVDVFSYGVMLLEIVSGRRNLEPTLVPEDQFYLPDWAWQLHIQGRILELIDPMLDQQNYHHYKNEAMRIIYVALLCVHKEGDRRPDMKTVVAMLHGGMDNEVAILVAKHECDHISSARSRGSFGDTESSLEISSLMSRDYVASNHSNSSLGDHNMFSPLYVEKNHLSQTLT